MSNCEGKISYDERKKGILCKMNYGMYKNNKKIYDREPIYKNSGKDFDGSNKIFNINGRYLPDPLYKKVKEYFSPTVPTCYIYIISKTIEGKIYFKIGEGGKGESSSNGRLGEAQTYLIPGMENAGYKVHYIFFFRKNFHYNSIFISQFIEKNIHKILQRFFTPINIAFASGEPSEWYLLQKGDIYFFLGFVFDIIGCYDHVKTQPLEIWKYSDTNNVEKINVPKGVEKRMGTNNIYKEIEQKLLEFNIRKKQRQLGTIIDKNVYDNEHINILRRYFGIYVRDHQNNSKIKFGNVEVILLNIKENKDIFMEYYSKYIVEFSLYNQEDFESLLNMNHIVFSFKEFIYITLKDFLKLYKKYNIKNVNTWTLKSIYDFYFSESYDKNIEIMENNTKKPGWYAFKSNQLYWARTMLENTKYNTHEDTSMDDETVKFKWKVIGYDDNDGIRVRRQQIHENGDLVEGTIEEVSVLRIMELMDIYEPPKSGKKNVPNKTTKLSHITIQGQIYRQNDIIMIKDNYFLWMDAYGEPDGIDHTTWRTYKIEKIYIDNQQDENINPWIDVHEFPKKNKLSYKLVANKFIFNKIKLIESKELDEPKYKKNDVLFIKKKDCGKFFKDEMWKKNDHYFIIEHVNRSANTYTVRFFPPFIHTNIFEIQIVDKYATNNFTQESLEKYKENLLFYIVPMQEILNHKPVNAIDHIDLVKEGRRNPQYEILFENEGEKYGIQQLQNANVIYSQYPSKVRKYWNTVKKHKSLRSTRKKK